MPRLRAALVGVCALALSASAVSAAVVLPPHAPQAAVDALRTAVERLNHDKAFAEETSRMMGFVPDYVAGPDTNRVVRQTLTVRPEIRQFVENYIKSANK